MECICVRFSCVTRGMDDIVAISVKGKRVAEMRV